MTRLRTTTAPRKESILNDVDFEIGSATPGLKSMWRIS